MPTDLEQLTAQFLRQQQIPTVANHQPYISEDLYGTSSQALAVLQPQNTQEVQEIVRFAAQHHIALVPQGGNSNRTIAAIPEQGRSAIVVSMKNMNRIAPIAESRDHIIAEAGCTLAQVQQAAYAIDRAFGIDLGARDWCQIGGNISTNAGGMQTVRFGNMREQVLGLEVITPDGEKLDMLSNLRKNNTGYDLKQLFIGAEGTLGIITRASLRLHPLPLFKRTAALACESLNKAANILRLAHEHWDTRLQRMEFISKNAQTTVIRTPGCPPLPFVEPPEALLLIEISELPELSPLLDWLETLQEKELIVDAIPAESATLEHQLWDIRERCGSIMTTITGPQIKHDLAVPPDQQPAFLRASYHALAQHFPDALPIPFGHWGDGNLHFNVVVSADSPKILAQKRVTMQRLIEDIAVDFGGTYSAEHGIGTTKKSTLARLKDPATFAMMQTIKRTLDPHNIMNPGKIIDL